MTTRSWPSKSGWEDDAALVRAAAVAASCRSCCRFVGSFVRVRLMCGEAVVDDRAVAEDGPAPPRCGGHPSCDGCCCCCCCCCCFFPLAMACTQSNPNAVSNPADGVYNRRLELVVSVVPYNKIQTQATDKGKRCKVSPCRGCLEREFTRVALDPVTDDSKRFQTGLPAVSNRGGRDYWTALHLIKGYGVCVNPS